MIDVLVLTLDAPLMAFGDVVVDNFGPTRRFPGLSMLTGLFGNALGWDHRDVPRLTDLQSRLRFACRIDRPGTVIRDFQVVDLGQDHLREGWTSWGEPEGRTGAATKEIHLRHRYYLADATVTVVASLTAAPDTVDLRSIEHALREPARPIFLGRKACLPARPLLGRDGVSGHKSLLSALRCAPSVLAGTPVAALYEASWPVDELSGPDDVVDSHDVAVTDSRDWANQIHVGRRFLREGWIRAGRPSPPGTSRHGEP